MNDFTKEELQIIFLDMNFYINSATILSESPSHKALRDKVKSMIENYCEHNYKKTLDKSGMYFIKMCHQCKDTKHWSIFDE